MTAYRFQDEKIVEKGKDINAGLDIYEGRPLFSLLEFNITNSCTRKCSFCPISIPDYYKPTSEHLSVDIYSKILGDLKNINYRGSILYSAFCEPMLHPQVTLMIKKTKETLGDVKLTIVTNGDLLTPDAMEDVFGAGLDTLNISLYDGPAQIESFRKMEAAIGLAEGKVIYRRRYYDDKNYGLAISNRGGLIDSNTFRDSNENKVIKLPLNLPCYYPFYQFVIDYNGKALLCPQDWTKSYELGNVRRETIWNIWTGEKMEAARKSLALEDRNFKPCDKCDVMGTVVGEESFVAWQKVNGL